MEGGGESEEWRLHSPRLDVLRVHDEAGRIVSRGVMVVWQDVGYSVQVSGGSLLSHRIITFSYPQYQILRATHLRDPRFSE